MSADEVISYARAHRAEIIAARERTKAAAALPKVVSGLPDPMLMVSIDHLPFTLDGINASIMIQQDFPLGGTLGAKKRVAEAEARALGAEVDALRLDIETQALGAFLMLAELQSTSEIVDEQAKVAAQILTAARARVATAAGALAETLRAELEVERLAGERSRLDAEMKSASAMLDAALGRPTSKTVPRCKLAVPDREPDLLAVLVARAYESRPELRAMKERVAKADADVDVMRSMYTPMAFVRTGGAYTMTDKYGWMLMVGVSLPIWRDKLEGGVTSARAMSSMASADVDAMKRMIEGDVASARESVIASRIRLSTSRDKLVPLAKKALAVSLASYAGGDLALVSVLESERALRDARMDEVVAEVKLAAAWARLGRAIGTVKVGAS